MPGDRPRIDWAYQPIKIIDFPQRIIDLDCSGEQGPWG